MNYSERSRGAAFALGVSFKVFSDNFAVLCNAFERSSQELQWILEEINKSEWWKETKEVN